MTYKSRRMVKTSIRLDPHIYQILKKISNKENISLSKLIREIIRNGINNMNRINFKELKRENTREERSYKLTRTLRSAEAVPELINRFIDLCKKGVNEHLIRKFVIDGIELLKTYDDHDILIDQLKYLKKIADNRVLLIQTIDHIVNVNDPEFIVKRKLLRGNITWIRN